MNRREALTQLKEGGTHSFYRPDFAIEVQQAFGIEKPGVQRVRANTDDPKGLFVDDVGPGALVNGYASHDLAMRIVNHLGLKVASYFGRGTQERACLRAIDEFLIKEGE